MAKEDFEKNKYTIVRNAIPQETLDLLANYTLFKDTHTPKQSNQTQEISSNVHEEYADHLMESLLLVLLPKVEEATGLTLFPTFSLYHVYSPGAVLLNYPNRPSCEISVNINFGYEYLTNTEDYTWNLWAAGQEFVMAPGDLFVCKGLEVEHWKEPLDIEKGWHSQASLYYVDADGPYSMLINDGRPDLGYTMWNQNPRILAQGLVVHKNILAQDQ